MRAIVWSRYGPPEVLQLKEVEKPIPKDDEVLIKIYATTVTAGDSELRSLNLPFYISFPMRIWLGFRKPRGTRIPGTEFSGEVESTGKNVKQYAVGDQVFGSAGLRLGTNAQYICLPEEPEEGVLAIKPANMSYEEAATVPFGALDALHFLKKANIQSGQKVLINGAGGSIGTYGVQLARYFGAEVTAVDSRKKLDMLSAIGAEKVIDYAQEDFTRSGEIYDVIFDVVGKSPYSRSTKSLRKNGYYLLANPRLSHMIRGIWTSTFSSKTVFFAAASQNFDDLMFLKQLIEAGKLTTVIDRSYPLEQIVEAHKYVETGAKMGNLVITVEHKEKT